MGADEHGFLKTRIFAESVSDLFEPDLDMFHYRRQAAESDDAAPNRHQNEEPGNERAEIILAGFIFTDECPDEDHDDAEARQSRYEQGKHPKPKRDVVLVPRVFGIRFEGF
jgi:hypothetical protein